MEICFSLSFFFAGREKAAGKVRWQRSGNMILIATLAVATATTVDINYAVVFRN